MVQNIGRYRILERIGRGGAGTVFKAHDPMLDRLVAIKVISSEGGITDELKTRFYREAQACARLIHPNIVVVHDLGDDQGRLYIVMEFLDGDELKAQIQQRKPLSIQDKVSLMAQVCEGLHYAHQHGVIHRDIKPGNIFILRNGQVKILDFGIARIATDSGLTRTGLVMGTLRYMSPEQARGKVDHRSDMFSAGTVFYELLGYKPAFDWDDPMEALEKLRNAKPTPLAQIDPTIPADLVEIVEQALQKDPSQRFPDMGEMRTRLEHVRRRLGDETEQLLSQVRGVLDEIRELQGRLAGARAAAAQVEAARHAAAAWSEAEAKAGEGARALEQHAYGVARGHFQDAVTAYERAAAAAGQAIQSGHRDQPRADAARSAAEAARAAAEQAEAQKRADAAKAARAAAEQAEAQKRADAAKAARAAAEQAEAQKRADAAKAARAAAEQAEAQKRADAAKAARAAAEQAEAQARADAAKAARAAAEQAEAQARADAAKAARAAAEQAEAQARADAAKAARAAAEQAEAQARADAAKAARAAAEQAEAQARADAAKAARAAAEQAEAQARADAAGRAAAEARQNATEVRAASLVAGKWAAAQAKEKGGQAAAGRKDFAAAEAAFGEARRLYDEATREAAAAAGSAARLGDQRAEVDRLRQLVAAARRAADEAGAGRRATEPFGRAKAAEQAAAEAVGRQAFDEAVSRLRAAEQAYQEAARQATEEVRTAKASAEQAARDASQAKQAVTALNPASRASSAAKWSAAQAREAAGQAAFGRGDWAAAQTLLGEARRLYDEVARDSRAVAGVEDRRKAAETESAGLREAVAAARRAAEDAGAAQVAAARAELQTARTAEQAGEAAFARRAHDEAQSQFRAAERAYQDAARHASAQQTASAAVAEARRLIAESHPDRALEALDTARASDPTHPEIPELEAQIERLDEERKRREQVQSLLAQARRLQAHGDVARALRHAEEAVQLAPADAAATRLRDDLQEAAHQAAMQAARPVEALPTASAPVAPVSEPPASPSQGRRASAPPARSLEPRRPAAVAPPQPAGRGFDPRKMAAVAAAGLVLAVGASYGIWSVTRPAAIPSVTTLEGLRERVAEARRGAQAVDAPGLADRLWTKAAAVEQDAEATLKRGDLASAAALFKDAEKAYRDAEGDARQKKRPPR